MIFSTLAHCAGDKVLPKEQRKDIENAIKATDVAPNKGAAPKIRTQFLASLKRSGWTNKLTVATGSGMTISASRGAVGLCLQTGNMSRMYADLMKLQTLYLDGAINSAAIVLPSSMVAKSLGSNIAASDRLERELKIFRKAYHVPTIIYALEVSE